MKSLNQPEGFVIRWAGKLGDFFGLSIVWLLCCLPLITVLPSCIALYSSVVHCVHGSEPNSCKHFFRAFRKEILRGMLLTLLWAALAAMLIFGCGIVNTMPGAFATVYAALYAGTMLLPLAVLIWLIPLQARFEYRFWELHKAAATFAVAHLPTTAVTMLILLATAILLIAAPVLFVLLPAIAVTAQSALIEKTLSRYASDTPRPTP